MLAYWIGAAVTLCLSLAASWKWELGLRRVAPPLVAICAASAVSAWLVLDRALDAPAIVGAIATAALAAGVALGVLASRFYRDPERSAPDDPRAIVSPADGRVIYVKRYAAGRTPESEKVGRTYVLEELDGSALARDEAIVVGIAMDFLDVHVNRAPLAGTVALRRRCPGRFASLKRPEAALENERVTTLFAGEGLELAVVQIASRLVRRIVSFVGEGDRVAAGDRIGVIRLGSQVDVVMPARAGLTLQAAPGDRVAAGTSVLAVAAAEGVASRESPEAVA